MIDFPVGIVGSTTTCTLNGGSVPCDYTYSSYATYNISSIPAVASG